MLFDEDKKLSNIVIIFLGRANMVDVGSKDTTKRMARAIGIVDVGETAYNLIANNQVKGMNF